jgi:hypothetical protein
LAVAVALALMLMAAPRLHAQGPGSGPLLSKHMSAGVVCARCHQESPPKTPVQTGACLTCHGPYATLASKTDKAEVNPHATHNGELDCAQCHHVHKASVNYCIGCHTQYDFKVP